MKIVGKQRSSLCSLVTSLEDLFENGGSLLDPGEILALWRAQVVIDPDAQGSGAKHFRITPCVGFGVPVSERDDTAAFIVMRGGQVEELIGAHTRHEHDKSGCAEALRGEILE